MEEVRIGERDLILPTLWCLYNAENRTLSTTELQVLLRQIMQPIGEDLEILAGRSDDKFSQKVRNLRSHKTLESFDFARYENRDNNGFWTITEKGEKILIQENGDIIDYLFSKHFAYDDVKIALGKISENKETIILDEDVIISEGKKKYLSRKVFDRSSKLRDAAIKHFFHGGQTYCFACDFNFEKVYRELGRGFIEIHHIKPVFDYDDSDSEKAILDALENVIPLCSNCHRMLHRSKENAFSVPELIKLIET